MTNTTNNNTTNTINYDTTKLNKMKKSDLISAIETQWAVIDHLKAEIEQLKAKNENVSAKAEKPSKKAEPKKEYGESNTITFTKLGKNGIEYEYADGGYVRHKGFRMYINSVLKNNGAKWNKDAKEWRFDTTKARDAFMKANKGELVFTTKQVDEYFAGLPQK